jgi:NhaA family Na+:H+ antiporter
MLNLLGFRQPLIYIGLGLVVWLAFLQSGVHATVAGVLVALTVPARYRIDAPTFLASARELLAAFEQPAEQAPRMLTDEARYHAVIALEERCEQVLSPLQRLEHNLHPWVSLVIMPVFALANAGVSLGAFEPAGGGLMVVLGVVLGLVLGKPIGLMLAAFLAVRLGLAELPRGAGWSHMLGAGVLAGIGFTMALFIATLAFSDAALLSSAKLGILLASLLAGVAGVLLLSRRPANAAAGEDISDL